MSRLDSFSIVIDEFDAKNIKFPPFYDDDQSLGDEDDEILEKCQYLKKLNRLNKVKQTTNFSLEDLFTLYRACLSDFSKIDDKRGRYSSYHYLDAITVLLAYYKTNAKYESFSIDTGYSSSKIKAMVDLVRPVLLKALKDMWWSKRAPPTDQQPDKIGLIVDSITLEVYRPNGRAEETKRYFDEKNAIYGLKKEVAIQGSAPYYAMFTSKGTEASVHGSEIFKKNYEQYTQYLKDPQNKIAGEVKQVENYAVLANSAYLGDESSTPGIRRVAVKKHKSVESLTQDEQLLNQTRIDRRVYIECFFARIYSYWNIFKDVYRLDHKHFDSDFDMCVLLTNQLISTNALQYTEQTSYRDVLNKRRKSYENKKEKQREARKRYSDAQKKKKEQYQNQEPNSPHAFKEETQDDE